MCLKFLRDLLYQLDDLTLVSVLGATLSLGPCEHARHLHSEANTVNYSKYLDQHWMHSPTDCMMD